MIAVIEIGNKKCQVDFSKGNDIAIPLNFNGDDPIGLYKNGELIDLWEYFDRDGQLIKTKVFKN